MKSIKKFFNNVINHVNCGTSKKDKIKIFIYLSLDRLNLISFKKTKLNFFIKNKDGKFFIEKGIDFFMYGTKREKEIRNYLNLYEGESFLDIGANIGKYSIIMANKYPNSKIFAFEPDKNLLKKIKTQISINKIKNITIFNYALSNKNGNADFYLNKDNSAKNTLYEKYIQGDNLYRGNNENYEIEKSTVELKKLDDLIGNNYKVGLIKIDVQGGELNVLKGAINLIKKDKPRIIFEAYPDDYKKIEEYLLQFNYNIKKIDEFNYFAE